MPALSETEIEAIASQQIALAKSDNRSRRASRDKNLDYYFGQMDAYVPPEPNRSRVVSRDVADTMSRMLPGIIRVYTASGRMAIAEPVTTADASVADAVTDGLNYVFWKDNPGRQVVYDATWDALLHGNGVVKTYYDDTPVYATSFHSGLLPEQVALLLADEGVEVLAQTARQVTLDTPEGPMPVTVHDLKIRRVTASGSFVVETIPPEEFLIHGDAIDTGDSPFNCHWQRVMRSDLIGMGYAKDDVWAIPEATRNETAEAQARRGGVTTDAPDKSTQYVDYYEAFARIDADGDGEAELVRICSAGPDGSKLLDWEVWEDEQPFDDIKCEPVPHRWEARSVSDETMDIQDIKTVLTRQLLNGTYWANNPQRLIAGKVENPDALMSPTFGEPVFAQPGTTVENLTIDNVGDTALAALAYVDEIRATRTGVSRSTMALDPEALQNQTAEAVREGKDASYSQVELVAANMADGWSRVFRKLMRLMIKHQDQPREVMLNTQKSLVIDPRHWNADMHVSINVGLGTGSRDRDLMHLRVILTDQLGLADRLMAAGDMDDAIDMLPRIVTTMNRMAEAAGIRNPEDYYPEFTEDKVAQLKQMAAQRAQQPTPEEKAAQAKIAADIEAQKAKAQADVVKNRAELEADLQTSAADRLNAMALEDKRQQIELEKIASQERIAMAKLAQERELAMVNMSMVDVETDDGPGEDGKPRKSRRKVYEPMGPKQDEIVAGFGAMIQSMQAMVSQMQELQRWQMAPSEIEVDPVTGRKRARKVMPQAVN